MLLEPHPALQEEKELVNPSCEFPPPKHSHSDVQNQRFPNLLFAFQMTGWKLSLPSREFASLLRQS